MKQKFNKGFTLIELLVVITLIAILAVAVLAAINPIEQRRKAQDVGAANAAAEIVGASERFYATYGCYPWEFTDPDCDADTDNNQTELGISDTLDTLQLEGEIKGDLKDRYDNVQPSDPMYTFVLNESANSVAQICFEPVSKTYMNQREFNSAGQSGNTTHLCVPDGDIDDL